MKNKPAELDDKSVKNSDKVDPSKIVLDAEDNNSAMEAFEKAVPFTTPILFDPNIWSDAFVEWVKKFNQDEFDKISRESSSES
ncbi:MAG: hypothetical protein OdinLCB4_003695 [Candidatus Odinarchaeum yellowstonii]|uniref:Uncharacterized protein n=1 Tax=Odinarchaeota yellowstonii (strain LCB_4) TaxID=1841599 RepID=A0AAF0D448_ODILC|nr:MAG: hypothetical protein OdinLCB4_003695 [Candidatus Odinarchaeum yellowstonii]